MNDDQAGLRACGRKLVARWRAGKPACHAVGLALLMAMLALPGAAHAQVRLPAIAPYGPPFVLMDQSQRAALGLRNGPDSIVDLWNDDGRTYLLFSGAALVDGRMAGGATFRLPVDASLHRIGYPLQVLMRATCRDGRPEGGRACTRFDSDYAGAGTVFTCPGGKTLYFYHGENHTMPNGQRAANGNAGWTGIGEAVWAPSRQVFIKTGQVAGLNAANTWAPAREMRFATRQTAAASGNPSVVADPSGAFLYLYFGDRTENPEATGPNLRCDVRACSAVARASLPAVCGDAGPPALWRKLHRGAFSEPAVLPDGTGGAFTPLLVRHGPEADTLANVTRIPGRPLYAMASVQRPGGAIVARLSADGLAWSAPTLLVEAPPQGVDQSYPRIVVLPGSQGRQLVLLYVQRVGQGWQNASLIRQGLALTQR